MAKQIKRKLRDKSAMLKPGGQSKYARKKAYLAAKSPDEKVWGFQVPAPKPWK